MARQFKLRNFEQLERREVMAGNVTIKFQGGNLFITGDNNSKSIEIRQPALDVYEVVGQFAAGSDTKINGVAGGKFTFNLYDARFARDIVVAMNGGHDRFAIYGSAGEFSDIDAKRSLKISMGSGDDPISLFHVETQTGGVTVDMGAGADELYY